MYCFSIKSIYLTFFKYPLSHWGFQQFCKVTDIFLKATDVTFLVLQGALRAWKAQAT